MVIDQPFKRRKVHSIGWIKVGEDRRQKQTLASVRRKGERWKNLCVCWEQRIGGWSRRARLSRWRCTRGWEGVGCWWRRQMCTSERAKMRARNEKRGVWKGREKERGSRCVCGRYPRKGVRIEWRDFKLDLIVKLFRVYLIKDFPAFALIRWEEEIPLFTDLPSTVPREHRPWEGRNNWRPLWKKMSILKAIKNNLVCKRIYFRKNETFYKFAID